MKLFSLIFAAMLLCTQLALAENSTDALADWRKKTELLGQLHDCKKNADITGTLDAVNSYAEKGDMVFQNALGDYFSACAPDIVKAEKWYSKAAGQGYPSSERAMAQRSSQKGNLADAADWWLKAAEHGDVKSQYRIGIAFKNGRGVKPDIDVAVTWLKKADAQNHKSAAAEIATIYRYRTEMKPDYAEAARWFRRGAELADTFSTRELGRLYQDGLGVQQNFAEAAKWFGIGAAQGDWRSMTLLASMYEEGKGFAQSWKEAYFWDCLAGGECPNEKPLPPQRMIDDCSSGMCILSATAIPIRNPEMWKNDAPDGYIGGHEAFSLGAAEDGKHLTQEMRVAIAKRVSDWKKAHIISELPKQ